MMRIVRTLVLLSAALVLAALPVLAAVGTAAPEFTLPAAPGGPTHGRFRLADSLHQKPVVVLFWATWCQPCMQELPLYQAMYQRYGGQLQVVGIAMDGPDSVSEVGSTARRVGLTFPVVTDLETQVVTIYNPRRAAPFSVWIDRTGTIVREHEGFSISERPQIEAGIAQLMGGARPAAPVPPTAPAPPTVPAPPVAPAPPAVHPPSPAP